MFSRTSLMLSYTIVQLSNAMCVSSRGGYTEGSCCRMLGAESRPVYAKESHRVLKHMIQQKSQEGEIPPGGIPLYSKSCQNKIEEGGDKTVGAESFKLQKEQGQFLSLLWFP